MARPSGAGRGNLRDLLSDRHPVGWLRVVARVGGSWIAATGLMLGSLA
jgi:hypothetical protein